MQLRGHFGHWVGNNYIFPTVSPSLSPCPSIPGQLAGDGLGVTSWEEMKHRAHTVQLALLEFYGLRPQAQNQLPNMWFWPFTFHVVHLGVLSQRKFQGGWEMGLDRWEADVLNSLGLVLLSPRIVQLPIRWFGELSLIPETNRSNFIRS